MNKKAYGFTIVELLIVIVVIGILAAISIVAYNGISNNANDNAVKSDLSNNAKRIEMWRTANTGVYPTIDELGASDNRLKFSRSSYSALNGSALYCRSTDGSNFALVVRSKSGTPFYVTNTVSVTQFPHNFSGTAATDCGNAGSSLGTGSRWLYSAGAWAPQVD